MRSRIAIFLDIQIIISALPVRQEMVVAIWFVKAPGRAICRDAFVHQYVTAPLRKGAMGLWYSFFTISSKYPTFKKGGKAQQFAINLFCKYCSWRS